MKKYFKMLMVTLLITASAFAFLGCGNTDENAWERVQKDKVLVVGTSADYPPYEFKEDGQFKGFEVELMEEIGSRLGVEIKWNDMSFDTLIASLKQGKIDVVVASMSASPERREEAGWSEVYYRGVHTFITKVGSDVKLNDIEDIVNYTVGVQTGSSHEEWLVDNMVKTGKMDDAQLLRYENANLGILDVANGKVDAFFTETASAPKYLETSDNLQTMLEFDANPVYGGSRMAVQKNQSELLEQINNVILQLQEEGFIDELVQKWLVEGNN